MMGGLGKPVKFARDGQEIPADIGNEMVRIMQDIARANGVTKPVVPNQLKVEPYPPNSFSEGRSASADRRDGFVPRDRGMGRARGHGYRWGDGYGRYGGSYSQYPYPSNSTYPYSSRWNEGSYYNHPYAAQYSRDSYGPWGRTPVEEGTYGLTADRKRPRSPSQLQSPPRKKSLYEMTYDEYLDCYQKVQERIQEVMYTGELWKALGMVPENYEWTEDDQRRIKESGWFSAWFGTLAGDGIRQNASGLPPIEDAESSSGSRVMTDAE